MMQWKNFRWAAKRTTDNVKFTVVDCIGEENIETKKVAESRIH
ncbi:MAG: hypothetical protein V8Q57_09195 [Blautia sp.]